jgi:hypothetical protein
MGSGLTDRGSLVLDDFLEGEFRWYIAILRPWLAGSVMVCHSVVCLLDVVMLQHVAAGGMQTGL